MSELVNVVWAKMTGYPWWPGIEEFTFSKGKTIYKRIRFFSCNKHADLKEKFVKDYLSNYESLKSGSTRQDFKNDLHHAYNTIIQNLKKSSQSCSTASTDETLQIKSEPEPALKPKKCNFLLLEELKSSTFNTESPKPAASSKDLTKISKNLALLIKKFRCSYLLTSLIRLQRFSYSGKDLKLHNFPKILKNLISSLNLMKGELIDEILNIVKYILKKWRVLIAKQTLAHLVENDGIKEFLNQEEKNIEVKTEEDYFIPVQSFNDKNLEIKKENSKDDKNVIDPKPINKKKGRKPKQEKIKSDEKNRKIKDFDKKDVKEEVYKNVEQVETTELKLINSVTPNQEFQEKVCKMVYKILLENGFDEGKAQELSSVIEQNIRSKDPTFGEKYQKLARIMIKDIKTLDKHSFEVVCASLV